MLSGSQIIKLQLDRAVRHMVNVKIGNIDDENVT